LRIGGEKPIFLAKINLKNRKKLTFSTKIHIFLENVKCAKVEKRLFIKIRGE
jgi:hypothetical protein